MKISSLALALVAATPLFVSAPAAQARGLGALLGGLAVGTIVGGVGARLLGGNTAYAGSSGYAPSQAYGTYGYGQQVPAYSAYPTYGAGYGVDNGYGSGYGTCRIVAYQGVNFLGQPVIRRRRICN